MIMGITLDVNGKRTVYQALHGSSAIAELLVYNKCDSAEITDELQEPKRHNSKTGHDRQKRSLDLGL